MNNEGLPPRKRMKIDINQPEDIDSPGEVICKVELNNDEHPEEESNATLSTETDPTIKVENQPEDIPSTSQYNNVTQEELQKLREFQVLDEVNDEDSKDEDSDASGRSMFLICYLDFI